MINITPEIAEICGIHAGDGYLRCREGNKGEVQICGSLEEKEYYNNHVIPLLNNLFNLSINGKTFSSTYGFVCYNRLVRETFLELGFPQGKKSDSVRVPKIILDSKNKELFCRFLRGIFDTDGNLSFRKSYAGINKFNIKYNQYPTIRLTTISKFLAEDIIRMLHELDILFFYFNHDTKKENEKRKYLITISGIDGLEKWMELIGMKNPVKLSRYLVWKKFGFCPTNLTLKQREEILNGELDIYSMSPYVNG
ncbi:MAG: LAGLIDADG family homing endonuclease [Candidatus Pacearchaeota archaeon]